MKSLLIIFTACLVVLGAQDFKYVGVTNCKMCHNKAAKGAQCKVWSETSHAGASGSLKCFSIISKKGTN